MKKIKHKYRIMKCFFVLLIGWNSAISQTLQTVTDNGNITTRSITVGSGYSDAKLNVNATGVDVNGTNDLTVLLLNQRYNSTNSTGDNRLVFGWANHWGAAIAAYKETVNTTGFKFFTEFGFNVPVEKMRITAAGNVGIGTSTPAEKLSVNGKIRAHEIKVETASWPDYVFAQDYRLPSLVETEKRIKEDGHLPGIPSAEEVKSYGIELGDMNAKLLKKIEELTLYLIEQEKRITKLESKK